MYSCLPSYTRKTSITRETARKSCDDTRDACGHYAGMEPLYIRIRRLRNALGLSQEELAAKIRDKTGKPLAWQSVQQWEKPPEEKGTTPRAAAKKALSEIFGMTEVDLIYGPSTSKPINSAPKGRHLNKVSIQPPPQAIQLAQRIANLPKKQRENVEFALRLAEQEAAKESAVANGGRV